MDVGADVWLAVLVGVGELLAVSVRVLVGVKVVRVGAMAVTVCE